MRAFFLAILTSAGAAAAEPLTVSLNFTTGGRWLEGTPVSVGRSTAKLEGSDLSLGGTVDVIHHLRLGATSLRLGGQLGVDALMSPRELTVFQSGPLTPSTESDASSTSVFFVGLSPVVGLGLGEGDGLHGMLDLLLTVEVASARLDGTRHFGFAWVPTARLGFGVQAGGFGFEFSVLGSFIGAQRVVLALGLRL